MITAAKTSYRAASRTDARAIAELYAVAGAGIPEHLWSLLARDGRSPIDVGAELAARDVAKFSWRNALLAEREGETVGMLLGYVAKQPGADGAATQEDAPAVLRPFLVLEGRAAGAFYISGLAVHAGHRGNGIGSKLLYKSRQRALDAGTARIAVTVFDRNEVAVRLYQRQGFRIFERQPALAHPCHPYRGEILLLMQHLN